MKGGSARVPCWLRTGLHFLLDMEYRENVLADEKTQRKDAAFS